MNPSPCADAFFEQMAVRKQVGCGSASLSNMPSIEGFGT